MDEVKIRNGFTSIVISKLVRRVLRKKVGYDIEIQMNEMDVTVTNEKTHVHLSIDAELNSDEMKKILNSIDLIV